MVRALKKLFCRGYTYCLLSPGLRHWGPKHQQPLSWATRTVCHYSLAHIVHVLDCSTSRVPMATPPKTVPRQGLPWWWHHPRLLPGLYQYRSVTFSWHCVWHLHCWFTCWATLNSNFLSWQLHIIFRLCFFAACPSLFDGFTVSIITLLWPYQSRPLALSTVDIYWFKCSYSFFLSGEGSCALVFHLASSASCLSCPLTYFVYYCGH